MDHQQSPQCQYGTLRSPTAPSPRHTHDVNPPTLTEIDDPRHLGDSPMPWLRYFFPKDFDVREGAQENPFYQYFDVKNEPLEEDVTVVPPEWAPNAFFRLSFTQAQLAENQDVAAREPDRASPLDAIDLSKDGLPLFLEGAEDHLQNVVSFCRSVATFKARTWKDAFPLVDLLRGVLTYLLDHMLKGQKLAREYALRDALKRVDEERARLQAEHAAAMAQAKADWEAETERRLAAAREAAKKQAAEELAAQMRLLQEEKEKWAQKCMQAEAQVKKLNDTVSMLERTSDTLQAQLEAEKDASAKALIEKQKEIDALSKMISKLQDSLSSAREAVLMSLKAKSKEEVMSAALAAISATMPGGNAYIAELKTQADVDKEDAGLAFVREFASAEPDGPVATGLAKIGPGFLQSPLGAGFNGAASRPTSATAGQRTSSTGGRPASASAAGLSTEELKKSLVLKYVKATPQEQAFMVGQVMPYGTGISWPLVEGGSGQQEVFVDDVSLRDGVHFFRPGSKQHGSYFAVPLLGRHGEVVGMLGVDTLAHVATGDEPTLMDQTEMAFVRELAGIINGAIARDQDALADLIAQATVIEEEVEVSAEDVVPVDPEPYADMQGGLKMFKSALDILKGLSDGDLDAFKNLDKLDDATLAVVRSVMAAVGDVGESDWEHLKGRITREMINKLVNMNPQDAWAEWQQLCKTFRPLLKVESEVGKLEGLMAEGDGSAPQGEAGSEGEGAGLRDTAVGKAFGRWVDGVRKMSSGNALLKQLEEKLVRANAALMRTFQGDGSSALQELRSYRVPPKITFLVLQAVLVLCGHSDDDTHNWGRMRVLTNYKMVKKLTELKPAEVSHKLVVSSRKAIRDVEEDDVKKESVATLALFRWLGNFCRLGDISFKNKQG